MYGGIKRCQINHAQPLHRMTYACGGAKAYACESGAGKRWVRCAVRARRLLSVPLSLICL